MITLISMSSVPSPSPCLYRPLKGELLSYSEFSSIIPAPRIRDAELHIRNLVSKPNYPCVAALRSFHHDDYQVGFYQELGSGKSWRDLRNDLMCFIHEQKSTASIYLTFWALFEEQNFSEATFENALWGELSMLTSIEDRSRDWAPDSISDPNDPDFCFSLAGTEFFVVGLHPNSSRKSRRFPLPALVFNVYNQFESLQSLGQYRSMVATNRKRDQKFQGQANPMVTLHGDNWESIQFSGKENPVTWRCPFHYHAHDKKP